MSLLRRGLCGVVLVTTPACFVEDVEVPLCQERGHAPASIDLAAGTSTEVTVELACDAELPTIDHWGLSAAGRPQPLPTRLTEEAEVDGVITLRGQLPHALLPGELVLYAGALNGDRGDVVTLTWTTTP